MIEKKTDNVFHCPKGHADDKFHKNEYGKIIDGQFVVTQVEFRCVYCHDTFTLADVERLQKEQTDG